MSCRISIVAAIGENRELGNDNKLLWHLPNDMARFKKLTLNHPIIMGRKTYESIGRPLPNRENIVITRRHGFSQKGVYVAHSLEEALKRATMLEKEEVFIIGGAEIFEMAMPKVDRLYLTIVQKSASADVYFPEYKIFSKVIEKISITEAKTKCTFVILEQPL